MRKLAAYASQLLLLAMLAGCGVGPIVREGDAHLLAQRADAAVRCYRRALERAPELLQDPAFVSKFNRANSLAHFQQAHLMASQGEWDEAVSLFTASVQADPSFGEAQTALQWAKREASKAHHKRALELADQGKLNQAILELKQALTLDPENLDAKDALESTEQKKKLNQSKARKLYDQALSLEKEKRWGQARDTLEAALGKNPNHLLCRVARWRARTAIASATELCSGGSRLLAAKRLVQAQAELRKALDIWPFYGQAKQLLDEAVARRQKAEALFRKAVALSKERKWDDVVAAAAASLDIYPYDRQAVALHEEGKRQAAAEHCEAGRTLLARGELQAAEARFLRALGYLPNMTAARDGLSQADYTRGLQAEKRRLWGNALVWYLQAADHLPKDEYAQRIATARARIFERVRFAMRLDVREAGGGVTSASAALRSRLAAQLTRSSPEVLSLVVPGTNAGVPTYGVLVELTGPEVRSALVRSENRVHPYTIRREVPNPEVPRLHDMLLAAQHDLMMVRREYNRRCSRCDGRGRRRCHTCRGHRHTRCSYCDGSGRRTCSACRGTGKKGRKRCSSCNGRRRVKCGRCGGDGRRTCSTCRGREWVECSHCHGSGRRGSVSRSDLRRAERRVEALRHRLHFEPTTVMADFPAEWPYVVHFHRKTGSAEASLRIMHPTSTSVVHTDRIRRSSVSDDATIDNPNPGVGLRPDPLVLPSDESVRQLLIDRLGDEAAATLISALLRTRTAELKSGAEALARQGNTIEAIEVLVDLARTIEGTKPKEASTIIERLKELQRTNLPRRPA